MCGILGWMTTSKSEISNKNYKVGIEKLFCLSETRGKEASGICSVTDDTICVLKAPIRAKSLIASRQYENCLNDALQYSKRLVMGHARMVTNGSASDLKNNQPITRGDLVCIHNGIIVNAEQLWKKYNDLEREAEVDTEVFLALMEKNAYQQDLFYAFQKSLGEIEGSLSIALVDKNSDWLLLYTNVGSLYVAFSEDRENILFSSERYILEQMLTKYKRKQEMGIHSIKKLEPNTGFLINLENGKIQRYKSGGKYPVIKQGEKNRKLNVRSIPNLYKQDIQIVLSDIEKKQVASLINVDMDKIHSLRRCTKCLLPETFPGIKFDHRGVCSICNSYTKIIPKGKKDFVKDLSRNHSSNSRFDCIAPISGGRDSCYILHYLVKELHLRPVAYTYDWGLVTDLARRNIQRMCSALGVEHILVSADIKHKRENVRKNVEAWLKRPQLGTIPLFMAGDKQFFYFAQLLKRQMHVDNVIFGMNALEETQFKARFIRMEHHGGKNDLYYNFSNKNKFELFVGYGKEFLKNPAYINESLLDSFTGFLSYYMLPQQYYRFFDYIPWDQKTIEDILINQYNWETATDVKETWRIGDGTAPFYNYIYYRMAGFTEFDTFKSNQIREGMLSREEALKTLDEANRISVDGFLWYCRTIGLDPIKTLTIINKQKTLYEV